MEKLIVISAPSGAGKSTIVNYLLKNINSLSFSISACSRPKRKGEIEGEDYYFISLGQFKNKIRLHPIHALTFKLEGGVPQIRFIKE